MAELVYTAPPTLSRFIESDDFVRCIVGPVGSGKSSVCVMEMARRAMQQAPGPDKVRRSRWAVIRNTYGQLRDTSRKTFEAWIPPGMGVWNEQAFTFTMRGPMGDGTTLEAEVLFRALDRPEDVKKLLSLDLTGAWINEAREIPRHVFEVLQTRVGRYPSKGQGGATWFGIWMDTNPWHGGHWAAKLFASSVPGHALFRQPGGRDADAENVDNLPAGYYDRLCHGKDREWIRVYVDGQDASGDAGSIWGEWIADLERDGRICAFDHPGDVVFTSWDLGRNDATAIWFWRINRDQVPDVLDYYEASGEGLGHFLDVVDAKGYDYKRHFLPHDARQRTLATQQSVLDQVVARWGPARVGLTPNIDRMDGIQAVRWMLEQPMRIHERCTRPGSLGYSGVDNLRSYRFKWDESSQVYGLSPVHDHASNGADAFRYMAVVVKNAAFMVRPEPAPAPRITAIPPNVYTMDEVSQMVAKAGRRRI